MRRGLWIAILVGFIGMGAVQEASAQDVQGFGLGGTVNSAGLAGALFCVAILPVDIEFGIDLDLQKLAGVDDPTMQFGFQIGSFIKAIRYEYINVGPQFHFIGAINKTGAADAVFHPLIQIGFRVEWFPDGNNHFSFLSALNVVVDIPGEFGPVLNPSTGLPPGSEGFGFGIAPNVMGGFKYYF